MFGEISNSQGENLDYSFHPAASEGPIVVLGHGVTGNKDRPFIAALSAALAREGFGALRFSFAGNGDSEGRFEEATISKEVDDLGAVLDALEGPPLCYVGHSMGAAVGVLRASQDQRISLLVSLAGMVHTRAFAAREFGDVVPDEGLMWDEPDCPLSQIYVDDMNRLDSVVERALSIAIPWLLVHGSGDDVVPIQDAHDIFARANEPKQLVQIPHADHIFSAAATATMVETVVGWLKAQSAH